MSEPTVSPPAPEEEESAPLPLAPLHPIQARMLRQVEAKGSRKQRAREEGAQSAWFGLGMFGMVGWSVAMPTLIGAALGMWLDSNWPGRYSWTLMLLLGGLALGCFNAWLWISREREQIQRRDQKDGNDD